MSPRQTDQLLLAISDGNDGVVRPKLCSDRLSGSSYCEVYSQGILVLLLLSSWVIRGSAPLYKDELDSGAERMQVAKTKHPGNAFVALRHDGRVCAVAGWDGKYVLEVSYRTVALR